MKKGAAILRRVAGMLTAGQTDEAAALLDEHFPADLPDDARPPRADLLRGWLQLACNDEKGVLALFAAAERDPALLGEAAQRVEDWLADAGKAHDTMLLRHELMRMHSLHANAGNEREKVDGTEEYRAPADELAEAVEQALAPWRGDIRVAWLAERRCTLAPRWRHHELLLELKPRQWHFRADARDRLQRYCRQIEKALPLCSGTIAVRAHPLLALPAHVRNMRKQARALYGATHETHLNQSVKKKETSQEDNGKGALVASLSRPLRQHRTLLASSAAAALLMLPMWVGWNMISNHETRQRIASLEQRHAAMQARRYWRREQAAGLFDPGKTVHAFFAALRVRDTHPRLPLFTAASYRNGIGPRLTSDSIRALWSRWNGCGPFATVIEGDRAVARWPMKQRQCLPLLLRRENGRWRIAWTETRATFALDGRGHWHFAHAGERLPHAWLFAFPELFPAPAPAAPAEMRKTPPQGAASPSAPLARAGEDAMNAPRHDT